MSQFNEYAKRLDKAFDDAATVQREALQAYQAAEQKVQAADTPAEIEAAKEGVKKAKEALDDVQRKTWPEFRKTRDNLGRELQAAIDKAEAANPDELDTNAVNLLYSDMITKKDLKELADKYKDNRTMSRMIGSKAEAMAENERDPNERRELDFLAHKCKKPSENGTMKQWNNLCELSKHYSGETQNNPAPEYVTAVNVHWRDATPQSAIESF